MREREESRERARGMEGRARGRLEAGREGIWRSRDGAEQGDGRAKGDGREQGRAVGGGREEGG